MTASAAPARRLGDDAVLLDVEGGYQAARELAGTISAREVVPAASTVTVVGEHSPRTPDLSSRARTTHELPVVFDGEDLGALGLSPSRAGELFSEITLEVAFLGFMPGFAYLAGLPDELARLDRRDSPRPRVPAGSLAVASGFAGIYPTSSPGGWHLLGRTDRLLFDHRAPPYALFQPGDSVRIVAVASLPTLAEAVRRPLEGDGLEVLDPGPRLLVEDLGRGGVAALGVPRAGAANRCWAEIANAAVGNERAAACLELAGPARLRALVEMKVALAGEALLDVGGGRRPPEVVQAVAAGEEIAVGPALRGRLSYLAVSGGLEPPAVLESRSADAVTVIPPGPLRAGDRISLGSVQSRPRRSFRLPVPEKPAILRVIAGPDEVHPAQLEGAFIVSPRSDRTGTRLERKGPFRLAPPPEVPSHGVVPGAVQLPPSGEAIVLGPDCGVVGGYPVGATVITADLWKLGALVARDEVSFLPVGIEEARDARSSYEELVEASIEGWFPTAFA